MDVRTYLRAIRKSWWLIVIAVLLGGVTGGVYSARSTPVYAASVGFFVKTSPSAATNAQSTDQYAQSLAVNLAKLLSSDLTARAVRADGVDLPYQAIASRISGSADLNTVIISAVVTDTSKARALQIARALSVAFPDVAKQVVPTGNSAAQASLKVTNFPSVGTSPILPRTKLNIVFGIGAGLALGLLLAVLRLLRDTSVRTREDVETIVHAPLIGDIGYDGAARTAPLVLERQAHSVRAEAFRQLRTSLQFVDAAHSLRVVVVTSSTESEGKSTTAINLALMFAETGRSVLLVGADLRRPRIAQYLGLESSVGLTNVLVNQVSLDDALQPWGSDGLSVLASGSIPPNPSELLGGPHMVEVLARLRRRFDLVIIDTPPLLPVTDAAVLAVHADGVVMVCRHGRTRRAQLATAVRALEAVNARVVGTVLNMRPARGPEAERYGSYSYYDDRHQSWLRRRFATMRRLPLVDRLPMVDRRPIVDRSPRGSRTDVAGWPADDVNLFPVPPNAGWAPPPVRDLPFDEQIGRPVDDSEIPDSALVAYERRKARLRRGRRRTIREHLPEPVITATPDIFEPRTFKPDTLEPDTLEPDTLEPDTLESDAFEPDSLEPDSLEPAAPEDLPGGSRHAARDTVDGRPAEARPENHSIEDLLEDGYPDDYVGLADELPGPVELEGDDTSAAPELNVDEGMLSARRR